MMNQKEQRRDRGDDQMRPWKTNGAGRKRDLDKTTLRKGGYLLRKSWELVTIKCLTVWCMKGKARESTNKPNTFWGKKMDTTIELYFGQTLVVFCLGNEEPESWQMKQR